MDIDVDVIVALVLLVLRHYVQPTGPRLEVQRIGGRNQHGIVAGVESGIADSRREIERGNHRVDACPDGQRVLVIHQRRVLRKVDGERGFFQPGKTVIGGKDNSRQLRLR